MRSNHFGVIMNSVESQIEVLFVASDVSRHHQNKEQNHTDEIWKPMKNGTRFIITDLNLNIFFNI